MECPRCTSEMTDGRCPTCGYTVATKRDDDTEMISKLKSLVTTVSIVVFLGYLILNVSVMLLSVDLVLPKTLTNQSIIFILFPIPVGLAEISGYTFAAYYLFLVFSVIISYIVLFYTGWNELFSYVKKTVSGKYKELDKKHKETSSPILRLVTAFGALVFITLVYTIMLELMGRGIEAPEEFLDRPIWQRVFSLTQAAVWEEFVTRVAYIGLPLVIYALIKGKKNTMRYLFGGFGFEEKYSVLLVIISTIIFAVAHLPGWNWDPLKVIQVVPAGIFFGYLFVKDGLHSAILIHFVWDYMFGDVPGMILDVSNLDNLFAIVMLFWATVGAFYTYSYIKKFTRWVDREDEEKREIPKEKEEVKAKKLKDHTAGVTIGYSCPNCGYTKAEYTQKDKLRCKRCGTESDPKSPKTQQSKNLFQGGGWPPS